MKRNVYFLVFLLAFMPTLTKLNADEIQVGTGTDDSAAGSIGAMNTNWTVYQYWSQRSDGICEYLISAAEMADAGIEAGAIINALGYFNTSTNLPSGHPSATLQISLYNGTAGTTAIAYPFRSATTMTLVKTISSWDAVNYGARNSWHMFTFDDPFEYTGGSLNIRFCVCRDGSASVATSGQFNVMGRGSLNGGTLVEKRLLDGNSSSNTAGFCSNPPTSGGGQNFLPNFMFEIDMEDATVLNNYYKKSEVKQASGTRVVAGMKNVPILKFKLTTGGDLPPYQMIDNLKFAGKNSVGRISNVRLYYVGNKESEDTTGATLLGEYDFSSVTNTDTFNFNFAPVTCAPHGNFYFLLVYDISRGCPAGTGIIDAEFLDMHLYTTSGPTTIDPEVINPDPTGAIDVIVGGYVYAGAMAADGTTPSSPTTYDYYFGGYYYNVLGKTMSYTSAELSNLGGTINNMAFWIYYNYNPTYSETPYDSMYIFMRNNPDKNPASGQWPTTSYWRYTTTTSGSFDDLNVPTAEQFIEEATADGFTLVKGPFAWDFAQMGTGNPVNSWVDMELDNPFEYEGNGLDVIMIHFFMREYYGASTRRYFYASGYGSGARYMYSYCSSNPINTTNWYRYPYSYSAGGANWYYGGTSTSYVTSKQYARFNMDYAPGQKFREGRSFHTNKEYAGCGATNVEVLGTNIVIVGKDEDPYMHAKKFVFDGKASYDNQQITHARLFYSGSDSAFSTAVQIGNTITVTVDNIHNLEFEVVDDGFQLQKGNNYFWLSYQIEENETKSNYQMIDARFVSCMLNKVDNYFGEVYPMDVSSVITTPDPTGSKTIRAPLRNGVYYVGTPFEQPDNISYSTLAACAKEFSEIGVTINTEIRLISSISDTATAIFGAAPFGDDIAVVMRPADGKTNIVLTNSKNDTSSAVVKLAGIKNFSIEGSNLGESGTSNDLILTKTGRGKVVEILSGGNETIRNVVMNGADNVIAISNTNGFNILNNKMSKSSGNVINIYNGSQNGIIDNNIIGYNGASDATIGNGIAFLNGSYNMVISNNSMRNISGNADVVSALNIKGVSADQNLNMRIYNNSIANVRNNKNAVATIFDIENASNVKLYHNTAIQNNRASQKYTTIFYSAANTVGLELQNNLFNNSVANQSNIYSQYLISPNGSHIFTSSEGNLYNGINVFQVPPNGTAGVNFEQWKIQSGKDVSSKRTNSIVYYVGDTDFHIDGAVCGSEETLVPVLNATQYPGVEKDYDGILRGQDLYYSGMTTVGHDEAMLNIQIIDTAADLPSSIIHCEDAEESIMLAIMKRFNGWTDGVSRSYVPTSVNTWINAETEEILSEADGGYKTDYYPFFYIAKPKYPQSLKLKCLSNVGYFLSESSVCDLKIVKQPEFTEQPLDVMSCFNSGVVEANSRIYGSYDNLQWEKLVNNVWTPVSGQTSQNMHLTFVQNQTGARSVEGKYRLRINNLLGYCNLANYYYSDVINVNVGYPLTNYTFATSHTPSKLAEGICRGESVWLAAGIPVGDSALVTGYRWEKFDSNIGEFLPISTAFNPTAGQDTFRIYSARTDEDNGIYRCVILGISACSVGDTLTLPPIQIVVEESAEIVTQPVPVFACIGSNLIDELSAAITEPEDALYKNEYAWYKDGKLLLRYNDSGQVISKNDSTLYALRRTDTTYLPFTNLRFNDEGMYQLRMIYTNCIGELDTTFSVAVALNVYGNTEIIEQTSTIYGVTGGFVNMHVSVVTPGSTSSAPVSYQWFRKHKSNNRPETLIDDSHYYGSQSPTLTIVGIDSDDLSILDSLSIPDYYYCVVKGLCNAVGDTSSPILLKVAPDIDITGHPKSETVCLGKDVELILTAVPTDITQPVSYTWYKDSVALVDGGNISGSKTNKLKITGANLSDAGNYYVVISYVNLDGAMKGSDIAKLIVETAPQIKIVGNTSLAEGDTLSLKVEIVPQDGAFYEFEWYFNNMALPGTNNDYYYVEGITDEEFGSYKVKVTSLNGCGESYDEVLVENVGIPEEEDANFRILNILPNPVSNEATINYILPSAQAVSLKLLDVSGSMICELYSGMGIEGTNSLRVNDKLSHLSNGAYFVVLENSKQKTSYKITIAK